MKKRIALHIITMLYSEPAYCKFCQIPDRAASTEILY